MGRYAMSRPSAPTRPSPLDITVTVLIFAALLAILAPTLAARVVVGGDTRHVPFGTTVADVFADVPLQEERGDLRAVDGTVLLRGGGRPPVLFHNGRVADTQARLRDGDRLTVRRGGDVTEGVRLVREPISVTIERSGAGPLVSLVNPGVVGVRERTLGERSGIEVSTRIVTPMEPMKVRRYAPPPGSRVVALTFDDGPWPVHTEAILDILSERDVRATFFMVGYLVDRYPRVAQRAVRDGHLIANHTYSHKILTRLSGAEVAREIEEGTRSIERATGVRPVWFRPPGGAFDADVLNEAEHRGLRLMMWDADPQDWRRPGVEPMLNELLKQIGPGSVVLLHDGGGDRTQTVELLPRLIDELRARGYIFLTVDELVH